ncbi:GvpL/GvpF family gas vesicle protein [Streptomyces piniterrae]|uniref:GvpL/GvpF family gas vesicle protein n=1 Tax=Streptomyces piniterrae TaxID=2571125 RepID=A0A4U0NXZ8_9ACTN|nr:GvpL/GvpF family gas vesicle protein [Streptomyces piniterrae]TJZ59072.1 GvpL/GvpF family gas vesicle protein [Streptomyces piniterrae]
MSTRTPVTNSPAGASPRFQPPHQPTHQPTTPQESGSWSSYVYAVGRAGPAFGAAAAQPTGILGGRVRAVVARDLAALVSSVPADAFTTDGMKAQLENLADLEVMARTHHAVVEAAHAAGTTVLPMRLATVYLDDARVRSMLQEHGTGFGELLSWLEGHVELGVKVHAVPRAAPAAAEADATGTAPASSLVSPGRAYLQRRRAQQRTQREVYQAAGGIADEVRSRAAALARAVVRHRTQQGELAPGTGENIANEAYLVPDDRIGEFHQALAGLADDAVGVRIEITGPWAPYSFATSSQGDGGTR